MPVDTMVLLDAEGRPHEMDVDTAARVLETPGWRVQTDNDRRARLGAEAREDTYGGLHGQITAGATGLARGATFGLSDAAIAAAGALRMRARTVTSIRAPRSSVRSLAPWSRPAAGLARPRVSRRKARLSRRSDVSRRAASSRTSRRAWGRPCRRSRSPSPP
jgi:hypothetical protein